MVLFEPTESQPRATDCPETVGRVRVFWKLHRDRFSPEFATLVDEELAAARAADKPSDYLTLDPQKVVQLLAEDARAVRGNK